MNTQLDVFNKAHALIDTHDLRRQLNAEQQVLNFAVNAQDLKTKSELLVEASRLAVEITDSEIGFLFFRCQADPQSARLGESVCYRLSHRIVHPAVEQASLDAKPVTAEHVNLSARYEAVQIVDDGRHLLVPFRRQHKILALLDLYRDGARFEPVDAKLAEELVTQLESLLRNQRMFAARTALVSLARNLSAELDLASLLEKVAESAANIANAQAGSILLVQPQNDTMRFAAAFGLSEPDREMLRKLVVPMKASMAGSVVLTGKPLISNDVAVDPRFYAGVSNMVGLKTRSLLAVPMIAQDKPIGALEVINQKYDDGFDEEDIQVLTLFASQAAIAIENARLLAEREARMTELMQLEQRKSQFIALASHELRTPLNIVSGYTTLLRGTLESMELSSDHESFEWLEQIEQATVRLITMVRNITSMHNLETGRTQLVLEKRDVAEIIPLVIDEYAEWCRKKGVRLIYDVPSEPLVAVCDTIEVQRILGNLVNNAVKFTPEGGQITIRASLEPATASFHPVPDPDREEVKISVSDTGPGIDSGQLETIFERFAQIGNHLQRVQGGIGLGLPLAKALVEKHGGRLWVESERDKGATFFFTLPAPKRQQL